MLHRLYSSIGRRKKLFLILFAFMGLFALWLSLPPADINKATLTNEMTSIQKDLGISYYQQQFRDGSCFDNCPTLTTTYKVDSTKLSDQRNRIISILRAHGYSLSELMLNQIIDASKENYNLKVGLGGHPTSELPLAHLSTEDNRVITKVVFVLDYNKP